QGVALAEAALARGATVTHVAAHLEVPTPAGVTLVEVGTAAELDAAMRSAAGDADTIIMAAAVADFRPVEIAEGKIKKDAVGETLSLHLERTPDVLAGLAATRREGQRIVGFAAETEADDERRRQIGAEKARRKGVDLLVVNPVGWSEGFGTATNSVMILDGGGSVVARAEGGKASVAHRILDLLV
ncbi:MAG: phosphopantothenoylcysteine decarboxylase, partial [Microbacteriaceae bacterium]|nr:phosphopantothenoylcysteine decarboxylase [Microbacteriaceae bacterium]